MTAAEETGPALLAEEIVRVPIDSISPHPSNPNEGDVGAIVESVGAVGGFYQVIIVQRSTGLILAGEHRWRALRAAGSAVAPVVFLDVDDETAVRILVGDNEIPRRLSRARVDDLGRLLADLRDQSLAGLSGTGFDDASFSRLLDEIRRSSAPPEFPDAEAKASDTDHLCPRCGYQWS